MAEAGAADWEGALDRLAELVDGYEALHALDEDARGLEEPVDVLLDPEVEVDVQVDPELDGDVQVDPEAADLLDYLAQNVEDEEPVDVPVEEMPQGEDVPVAEDVMEYSVEAPGASEEDLMVPEVLEEIGVEVEDEQELAQKAMDAMLVGDMEAYESWNAKLVQLQASIAMEKLTPGAESALNELKTIPPASVAEELEVKVLDAAGQFLFTAAYFGSFQEVPVPQPLLSALTLLGMASPTQVQQYLWPMALMGLDVVAVAPPAAGKTMAYLLPTFDLMLKTIGVDGVLPQAERPSLLILAPTHAAGEQILEETGRLSEASGVAAQASNGIDVVSKQPVAGTHVLIATPSEALEWLGKTSRDGSGILAVVLDGVDRMLDMGMDAQIRKVMELVVRRTTVILRQTMMFSSSYPASVKRLSSLLRRPNRVQVGGVDEVTGCRDAAQLLVPCKAEARMRCLLTTLRRTAVDNASNKSATALIVCTTLDACKDVKKKLAAAGMGSLTVVADASDASLVTAAVNAFSDGAAKALVATDEALKGMELRGVPLVVSYDTPQTLEEHLRRCSRAGSLRYRGVVVTLVTEPASAAVVDIADLLNRFGRPLHPEITEMAMAAARKALRAPNLGIAPLPIPLAPVLPNNLLMPRSRSPRLRNAPVAMM